MGAAVLQPAALFPLSMRTALKRQRDGLPVPPFSPSLCTTQNVIPTEIGIYFVLLPSVKIQVYFASA